MIYLGSDHAGFELKQAIIEHLKNRKVKFEDYGTFSPQSVDYAIIARRIAESVVADENNKGILICGTGIGISIAANKIKGVRAACCSDCYSTRQTRQHNNANILCLGGRVLGPGLAADIVDVFLGTPFDGGERHVRRIQQISQLENGEL